MAEYIDRENYCENICHCSNEYCDRISCPIWKAPAADVAPVRHGKWAHSRYENCSEQFEIVKCSCCGHEAYAMAFYVRDGNYCPNCGARMDGDGDA